MAVPSDVVDFVRERGLTQPSWRQTILRASVAVTLYGAAGLLGLAVGGIPGLAVAWLLQGLLLNGALSAVHNAFHRNLVRNSLGNRVLGTAFATAAFVPFSQLKAFHLYHHVVARLPEDPEPWVKFTGVARYLATLPLIGPAFVLSNLADAVRAVSFGPRSRGPEVGGRPAWKRGPSYVRTTAQRRDVAIDLAILTAAVVLVVVAPFDALRWWFGPAIVGYVTFFGVLSLPEHYRCHDDREPLSHTRTTISNPVFRFLYWNDNFHADHHLVPSVPYHRVPELHRFLEGRHQHLAPSFLGFQRRVIADLRRGEHGVFDDGPDRASADRPLTPSR